MDRESTKQTGLLRLYVSGQTPKSIRARANLHQLGESYLKEKYQIEICDLDDCPEKAEEDEIVAIPTLVRCAPLPVKKIVGDLSDTDQVLHVLNEADHVYRSILEVIPEGYVTLDLDGTIIFCNKTFSYMVKQMPEMIVGTPITKYVEKGHGKEIVRYLMNNRTNLRKEMGLVTSANTTIPVLCAASRLTVGGSKLICVLFSDISSQKEAENALRRNEEAVARMAFFDKLTGLPNRSLFMDRLGSAILKAQRSGEKLAVMFIDLDNFKKINDSLGHDAGDQVLAEIAERMSRGIRAADTLSRISGDEFALLMHLSSDIREAEDVGCRILQAVPLPLDVGGTTHVLSASIGIAVYPDHGQTGEELLKNADTAMYRAKAAGKNRQSFFGAFMKVEITQKALIEQFLRDAVDKDELRIHFQPIYQSETGDICGMEALARWNSIYLGDVSPSQFIPLAEESRLIHQLGARILKQACIKNKEWQDKGLPKIPITVNISPRQLEQDSFVDQLVGILKETALEPQYLDLEITEGVMLGGDIGTVSKMEALRALGIKLSLDDFGTGCSSLTNINMLPIETLKIDRSFIANIEHKKNDFRLVRGIISLAHGLGLRVVAEGVEKSEQANVLKKSRCDLIQGFLYSPPVDAAAAEVILAKSMLPS